ncbi:MAG: LacI family DNA-binding transcriptional regulator [Actinomycetota bacterium]|nr:LacI family DNA-binding transcriptional regulator [Actinomycetota bacterium]
MESGRQGAPEDEGGAAYTGPHRHVRRRRVGMREVAERAGVAISSVSRTLSGHPDVSEEMREQVMAAVSELGYKPDLLAQGLRSRSSLSIGFVAGDISNPLFAQIARGAEVKLRENEYSMLLTNSLVEPDLDRQNIELLEQRRADGLIVLLVSETHEPTLNALANLTVPLVVVERDLPPRIHASKVVSDHAAGVSAAVEHLLELGHRRIAIIGGPDVRPTRQRLESAERVLAERGLDPSSLIARNGLFSEEHGVQATAEMLNLPEPPTALIAGSNQIMAGALQVISEKGLELGRELSFIGYDDIAVAKVYRPPISVVERDLVAIGEVAAELLLTHVRDHNSEPQEVVLPTRYIRRGSCGPAPN